MKVNSENLEQLVEQCLGELATAQQQNYDPSKAEKTAALFLSTQMQLALYIEDIELKARHSKSEIDRVEGEKYFEIKENSVGKKLTENALTASIAKDEKVMEAKSSNNKAEAELKKYNYILQSLREGHLYFRNLSKNGKEMGF